MVDTLWPYGDGKLVGGRCSASKIIGASSSLATRLLTLLRGKSLVFPPTSCCPNRTCAVDVAWQLAPKADIVRRAHMEAESCDSWRGFDWARQIFDVGTSRSGSSNPQSRGYTRLCKRCSINFAAQLQLELVVGGIYSRVE